MQLYQEKKLLFVYNISKGDSMNKYFEINPIIEEALKRQKPIVALESTIIAHGMPYPQNRDTALKVESIVREQGAVPATIAIIQGKIKIGLTEEEIDYLARTGTNIPKASRRDISYLISQKKDGATTVAATALIAALAKIKVFATGGIGGVHRGAETSFDISSDLEELTKSKVVIVSAGAKSILDLNKTIEVLETKAVEVIGYQTDFFPAFYVRESSFPIQHRLDSVEEIAELIKSKWSLGLDGGILICNPIPKEYSLDKTLIDKAITDALIEMDKLNIVGNKTTPFLLSKIKELTKGKSLEANIALIYNNASLAARIAKAL